MNNTGITDLVPKVVRDDWRKQGYYVDKTVFSLFREKAELDPGKVAVIEKSATKTYQDILTAAKSLATALRKLGIVQGDVVAYELINSWRSCVVDLAVTSLGAVVAPFPPGRGSLDTESLLKRCHARAVIVHRDYCGSDRCEVIRSMASRLLSLRFMIVDGELPNDATGWHQLDELLRSKPILESKLPTVDPNSPARLLVSSGTESEPKLVAYSHNAMVGGRGRFLQNMHGSLNPMRVLYLVPLGSSFGSTATFGVLSWMSGSLALMPKFDPLDAIELIQSLRPNYIFGVPTMFQRMAAEPRLSEIDKSSLISIVSGGAVIDKTTIERCCEAFGCKFTNLYGSADGVNCHNSLTDSIDTISYSVGKPNSSVCRIRIVDEYRNELANGEVGEISALGPLSPMQYVNAAELDQYYRDSDGWVYTGDLAYVDKNGQLILSGRKKDVIIRGGMNISPVQIETLAVTHPDIVSAACVPVEDEDLGQRVCICLSLRVGASRLSLDQLSEHLLSAGLEKNKLPEYLRYCKELPISPAGKVDKHRLKSDLSILAKSVNSAKPVKKDHALKSMA